MKNVDFGRTLVVGLGVSGIGAAELLKKAGAEVTVYDGKPLSEREDGDEIGKWTDENGFRGIFGHDPEPEEEFDTIVVSPGVPPGISLIAERRSKGVRVIGELELAYLLTEGRFIAITGTNGKTTTTVLTGEIMKNSGYETEVVGNVGLAVTSRAETASSDTWLVTECSSFQLETVCDFRPKVSALLNVTPDHLNRHGTLENYAAAKARVFMNQSPDEYFVVNADDELSLKEAEKCAAKVIGFSRKKELEAGAFVRDGEIIIADGSGLETKLIRADELKIPGSHNLENALAAAAVTYFAGASPDAISQTLRTFEGVAHRIEYCGTKSGIRFVNDSKGTNPDAAIKAVEAIEGGIVLIAGGYDKGSEFGEFIGAFGDRVRHMVLIGVTAEKIAATADRAGFKNYIFADDMADAVGKAYMLADAGNTVLLSPACASWDMYRCFEDRGDDFKSCFEKLEEK